MTKRKNLIIGYVFVLLVSACSTSQKLSSEFKTRQNANSFEKVLAKKVNLNYLKYIPEKYSPTVKWPLLVFLHGAGERGNDLEKVKLHGPPKLVEEGREFPFLIISPQCPSNERWTDNWKSETIIALIDEIIAKYNIDEDRIYLTGLSMGGQGTWDIARKYPTKFAAIAPVCGRTNPNYASQTRLLPTWVFHGAKDNVVPIEHSHNMVDALKANMGNIKFTIYPEANHDSWTETYNNEKLFSWFLSHKRNSIEYLQLLPENVSASTGNAFLAVDGKENSRWESKFEDQQWFKISFDKETKINQMTILWENAYCKEYNVLASQDSEYWKKIIRKLTAMELLMYLFFPIKSLNMFCLIF